MHTFCEARISEGGSEQDLHACDDCGYGAWKMEKSCVEWGWWEEWTLGILRVWWASGLVCFPRSETSVPVSSLGLAHPSSVYYIGLCFLF